MAIRRGYLAFGLAGLVGCGHAAAASSNRRPSAPTSLGGDAVQAAAPAAEEEGLYDYQTESLGSLRFGLNAAAVERLLGAPEHQSTVVEQAADGLYVMTWDWPAQGVAVELAGESASGPFEVQALSIRAPSQLRTARGIGLGADAAAIVRAYGADHTHVSDDAVVVGSLYGGLRFDLEQGAVRTIFIGASAE
jgi:hypothetical protein